jgi:3-hydroxybutyryl-CoA dehydrogenase
VLDLAKRLGKTPVVAKDVPGFIVNRVLIPMVNEAIFVLEEGVASVEDIDLAMTAGANHPMGPLALADRIGLDTVLAICEVLYQDLGDPKFRPCSMLRRYVEAGWLGRKSGRGFYVYEGRTERQETTSNTS